MKLISCHDGKLHALEAGDDGLGASSAPDRSFVTGLPALDALPPGGAFARGAVHELLAAPADGQPLFFAAVLARGVAGKTDKGIRGQGDKKTNTAAIGSSFQGPLVPWSPCPLVSPDFSSAVIWSDPAGELYPPALADLGIPLERLFLLRPGEADHVWAIAECLRCRGVAAVVAGLPERRRLSRIEARRLQLAAERGGGVGLLLRATRPGGARGGGGSSVNASGDEHAAVTRWLVRPEPGDQHVQRWRIQLIFGHGGRVGQSIVLEHHHRDHAQHSLPTPRLSARPVHPAAELADRPAVPAAAGRATG